MPVFEHSRPVGSDVPHLLSSERLTIKRCGFDECAPGFYGGYSVAGAGGVVGPDFMVHGTSRLSVVDARVFPLVSATYLSSTVYAVADMAADSIKART
jgi:hypothetical protein